MSLQSCPTLWDPMDFGLPSSSVQGIFQARVLEWIAIAFWAHLNKSLREKKTTTRHFPLHTYLGSSHFCDDAGMGLESITYIISNEWIPCLGSGIFLLDVDCVFKTRPRLNLRVCHRSTDQHTDMRGRNRSANVLTFASLAKLFLSCKPFIKVCWSAIKICMNQSVCQSFSRE